MPETETPSAPSTFAEFEAGGGKYKGASAPVETKTPPAEPEPAPDETPEPEPAPEPTEGEPPEEQPATAKAKPKLSLADERAKLLREVTELRKQRRELQQPPAAAAAPPTAGTAKQEAAPDDRPPELPSLFSFTGTGPEFDAETAKKQAERDAWFLKRFDILLDKREAVRQAQAEQERIKADYGAKVREHVQAHPEYDAEIGATPITELMADFVMREGPALGQALLEDKENARRIASLPPPLQVFEMGKLASAISPNGGGKAAEAEAPAAAPVKVPAKVGASGGASSVLNQPGHGAKNYAEFEAIEQRLKKKK
jgi:hypothetical protein